jgi:hypothetical protein
MGEFSKKLDDYPMFQQRKQSQGDHWYGDMGTFQKVKDRLGGCHPFAWYLRRFKTVYEDAGIVPSSIYMIKEESSGLCLLYQGQAGTSGQGREGVVLDTCDEGNHRFFWHPGNRRPPEGKCCSGIRAWNTDQCFEGGQGGGKAITGICEVSGSNGNQHWKLHKDGSLKRGEQCIGPGESPRTLQEGPCFSFRSRGGAKFSKQAIREPIETQLYHKAQHDHPEIFARLNKKLQASTPDGPRKCNEPGIKCVTVKLAGSGKCIDDEAKLTDEQESCMVAYVSGRTIRSAQDDRCLDDTSDSNANTWTWYGCHGGGNQQFNSRGSGRYCGSEHPDECLEMKAWP